MAQQLTEILNYFLEEYIPRKKELFGKDSAAWKAIHDNAPSKMYETGLLDANKYLVIGSVGRGNWTDVPWLAIFRSSITISAQNGVYIVYLLNKNGNSLDKVYRTIEINSNSNTLNKLEQMEKIYPKLISNFKEWLSNYWTLQRFDNFKNYELFDIANEKDFCTSIILYIAGMTDNFAIETYNYIVDF